MILSGENTEINTKDLAIPQDFIFVNWNCYAVKCFDDVQEDYYHEFEDFNIQAFNFDDKNEEYEIGLFPTLKHFIEEKLQEEALRTFLEI